MTSLGLSVILITKNEEKDVRDCLDRVKDLADEIVVVDSHSDDRTVELCRQYTNKIVQKEWQGFGPQKQHALDLAKGPWILNVDADERVTPALRDELRNVLAAPTSGSVHGFEIPFRNYFLGRRLRFGGGFGERHVRLFRKEFSSYGDKPVHEGINVSPPIGRLNGFIDHYSYRTLDEYLAKRDRYTALIAQEKFSRGARFHWWHHLRLPYEFVVRFFLKGGFLDGGRGLRYAVLSSYYVWMKFLKLRDLERQ